MNLFSNVITNKNFSLFSSLFLLASVTSLILSFIARKEIRLYRKSGRKIARFTYKAAFLEIIIFLILLVVYFIR
jgi:alpha-N-acetylglucosamine transferase